MVGVTNVSVMLWIVAFEMVMVARCRILAIDRSGNHDRIRLRARWHPIFG